MDKDHARFVVKRITMLGVDMMLLLENYEIHHPYMVDDIMSLKGYIGRLVKMLYAKSRHDVEQKQKSKQRAKRVDKT